MGHPGLLRKDGAPGHTLLKSSGTLAVRPPPLLRKDGAPVHTLLKSSGTLAVRPPPFLRKDGAPANQSDRGHQGVAVVQAIPGD